MLEIKPEVQSELDHLDTLPTEEKIVYIRTLPNPMKAKIGMASEAPCIEINAYAKKKYCKHLEWCKTHNNKEANGNYCEFCAPDNKCKTCGWFSKYEYCSAYCEPDSLKY